MNVATGTLQINPAFLQDIKDDNIHLKELLDATAKALSKSNCRRIRVRALADLLASLRDQIGTHFCLEEFYGYFDDAKETAPHLATAADHLRSQHDTLYLMINDLASDAEQLLYGPKSEYTILSLSNRFHGFYEQLQEHERAENDLIMQAFYEDIGCGD